MKLEQHFLEVYKALADITGCLAKLTGAMRTQAQTVKAAENLKEAEGQMGECHRDMLRLAVALKQELDRPKRRKKEEV